MRINNNIMAMNTYRQLGAANTNASKSMEKLSSGLKINKAGDDAAGLAISEKMRSQIRGLNQASRNAQDGISMIQTAEGALNEVHSILQRIRELAVQANNGTNTAEDKAKIQAEIVELRTEITDIAERTEFNGRKLLDGTLGATVSGAGANIDGGTNAKFKIVDVSGAAIGDDYTLKTGTVAEKTLTLTAPGGTLTQTITVDNIAAIADGTRIYFDKIGVVIEKVGNATAAEITTENTFDVTLPAGVAQISFQIGANSGQSLAVSMSNMKADQLGSGGLKIDEISVTNEAQSFAERLASIDAALTTVSQERAKLGAYQNRLEHTITNLDTSSENLQAAESRIRDVDMAKEMMEFTKNNILQQAATAMLAQANQAPQGILQLLR